MQNRRWLIHVSIARLKRLTLLLIMAYLPCSVGAEPAPEKLLQALEASASSSHLRGTFQQTKTLRDLPVPLRSAGEFEYHQTEGLRWHTLTPIEQLLAFDSDGTPSAGLESLERSQAARQVGQLIGQIFIGLFTGKVTTLEQHFHIEAEGNRQNWQLHLTPKAASLTRVFQAVNIRGADTVHQVEILEASGDTTRVELQVQSQP